jgi:hypothetical protein
MIGADMLGDLGMFRCADCRWLEARSGECLVARNRREQHAAGGTVEGDFPKWRYRPHLELKRRCDFGRRK